MVVKVLVEPYGGGCGLGGGGFGDVGSSVMMNENGNF